MKRAWIVLNAVVLAFVATGCLMHGSYRLAEKGAIPPEFSDWEISDSPYYSELVRTYGSGEAYERAKIKYLLGHTRMAQKFTFDRNGHLYESSRTADHLTEKYQKRFSDTKTARDFINNIASVSSESRRAYFAISEEGLAYRTGDLLHHELDRLEKFMHNKATLA